MAEASLGTKNALIVGVDAESFASSIAAIATGD
jgi:hypothetical protein